MDAFLKVAKAVKDLSVTIFIILTILPEYMERAALTSRRE